MCASTLHLRASACQTTKCCTALRCSQAVLMQMPFACHITFYFIYFVLLLLMCDDFYARAKIWNVNEYTCLALCSLSYKLCTCISSAAAWGLIRFSFPLICMRAFWGCVVSKRARNNESCISCIFPTTNCCCYCFIN